MSTKLFAEAAHEATQNDPIMHAGIKALLEALVSIRAQVGKLDAELKELAGRSEVAWRLMSVPSVSPITALAFVVTIEDVKRFSRTRDIGAYLWLTEKRYQSGETDIKSGISKAGDSMARQFLYEAANVMLTTVAHLDCRAALLVKKTSASAVERTPVRRRGCMAPSRTAKAMLPHVASIACGGRPGGP